MPELLFVAFGSAGDVYPVLAIAAELRTRGVSVAFAVNADAAALPRAAGFPTASIAPAQHHQAGPWPGALDWPGFFSAQVLPLMAEMRRRLKKVLDSSKPSAVVATSLCGWSKSVVERSGAIWLRTDMYPELADGVRDTGELAEVRAADALATSSKLNLALNDPRFSRAAGERTSTEQHLTGFPGGVEMTLPIEPGGGPEHDTTAKAKRTLLCTMGSFLGRGRPDQWVTLLNALVQADLAPMVIGVDPGECRAIESGAPGSRAHPFVPMTSLIMDVDAVLHHGGIGSSYLTLLAGRPSVVRPIGFDQPFNAKWLQDHGCAISVAADAPAGEVAEACVEALTETSYRETAARIGSLLVGPTEAAATGADLIMATLGQHNLKL